jgi:diaminobutyrate-2-oxoglutarate transaminase
MEIFERLESQVRSYCRAFPTVFATARGSRLTDEKGREFIDFFSGAGTLNYGHNHPRLKEKLLEYLLQDGVVHSLDMATQAKGRFLRSFEEIILAPRVLDYKVQFPGPTGTNAVEAALKLARKVTGRTTVVGFTNGYHGMTLGALAVTGNGTSRAGAGVPLSYAVTFPYDGYLGPEVDTLAYLKRALDDPSSGLGHPAAVILETVQAEGGVRPASFPWLKGLARLVQERGILLIVDDIQVGCGRTGPFFSFEGADIAPDIVCLSKSISGFGLPMALVLLRPELDRWLPGEHNGTFRGNNAAFVTAAEALEFWRDETISQQVRRRESIVRQRFLGWLEQYPECCHSARGRGLIQGLVMDPPEQAARISKEAFAQGLIIEVAGPRDEVLKILPPLTIEEQDLRAGLDILGSALSKVLGPRPAAAVG